MCTNIKELVKEVDAIDYDYVQESNKTIYDKEASAKEAEIYNKYIKAELRYTGSDDVIATFGFQRYLEDFYDWSDGGYEDWGIGPIIILTQDDSKYSFEEYFDDNVSVQKLIDEVEDFGDQYEKYLGYLK